MTHHDDASSEGMVAGSDGIIDEPVFEDDSALSEMSLEREDNRWARARGRRDWLILGVMVACYLCWTLTVFFFEPGIR